MVPIDIDAVIREDLPVLQKHNRKGLTNLETVLGGQYPNSVHVLYIDLIDGNQRKYKAGIQRILKHAEYLSLIAHLWQKRETGGSYQLHPHGVAKSIVQNSNEPYYTVVAGLMHDIFEMKGYSNREIPGMIRKYIHSLNLFAVNNFKRPYANKVCNDMTKLAVVLDKLTRRKGENYFDYIERLLGPYLRPSLIKDLSGSQKIILDSIDEIIRSAVIVKLRDREHNIKTMQALDEENISYPYQQQLYNIYKNILILSAVKRDDRARPMFMNDTHFNDLIEASISQLEKMMDGIKEENPNLTEFEPKYAEAIEVYDKLGGFWRRTKFGETKIPDTVEPDIAKIAKQFDGTMSKYAGYIYKKLEDPKREKVGTKTLYLECMAFTEVLKKIRDDKIYAPDFTFSETATVKFISTLPRALL